MKKADIITIIVAVLFWIFSAFAIASAAEVTLKWDASEGSSGYKIYKSIDGGNNWDAGTDVGNVTQCTITDVPDSGMVIFRVSAYNTVGESVRYWSGAWYCGDWKPVADPGGAGID